MRVDSLGVAFAANYVQLQVPVADVAVGNFKGEVAHGVEAPLDVHPHGGSHQKAPIHLGPAERNIESIGHVAKLILFENLRVIS